MSRMQVTGLSYGHPTIRLHSLSELEAMMSCLDTNREGRRSIGAPSESGTLRSDGYCRHAEGSLLSGRLPSSISISIICSYAGTISTWTVSPGSLPMAFRMPLRMPMIACALTSPRGSTVVGDMEKSHRSPVRAVEGVHEAYRAHVSDSQYLECMAVVNKLCF